MSRPSNDLTPAQRPSDPGALRPDVVIAAGTRPSAAVALLVRACAGRLGDASSPATAILAFSGTDFTLATDPDLQDLARLDTGGNLSCVVARLCLGEAIRLRVAAAHLSGVPNAVADEKDRIALVVERKVRSLESWSKVASDLAKISHIADLANDLAASATEGWVVFAGRVAWLRGPNVRNRPTPSPKQGPAAARQRERADRSLMARHERRVGDAGRRLAELVVERNDFALEAVSLANSSTVDVLASIADVQERQRAGKAAIEAIKRAMALGITP